MQFVVRFHDHQSKLHIREKYLQEHIDWLEEHSSTVLVAGSLRAAPSDSPVGACWIVEADDKSVIESLINSDPFWKNGLREGYEIHCWSKAFPEKRVAV